MPSSGLVRFSGAAHEILDRAAADFIGRSRASLPDLTSAVIVVPDPHAAGDVARALRAAARLPALLLPRITTLEHWAAEAPPADAVVSRAAREALLYRELRARSWLQSADLWAVAAELAGLFDELTRHHFSLPRDAAEFARQLERAYGARAGESLTFEARLVHELWHVATGATDAEAAYQLALSRLADEAAAPLYALGLSHLAPSEERFLEAYAERAPVYRFDIDAEAGGAVGQVLAVAWPREAGDAGLRDRANALKAALPSSPLAGRLRIVGAASGEQEAQAVDVTVREWLLAGKRRIAVVVQDRLVARRARALLERAEVLVKDEAGWAFSTTSAATVVGRWLDVAGGDCYYRDLLDLLKSPFVFEDWPREARLAAALRLERHVRRESVVSGLSNFIRLAEDKREDEARQLLVRLHRGAGLLGRGTRTLPQWISALTTSLEEIGVRDGLAADSAGAQLLDLLERLARDLADDQLSVDFAHWRRWLARQLEAETFRDSAIESPVVFTSLAATRLRSFDATLILGADAAHLPGPDPVAMFFNQGVRAELKLPTWAERVREMEEQLAALIACSGTTVVTWQDTLDGEDNLLSPLFERLVALHRLAYEIPLDEQAPAARLAAAEVRAGESGGKVEQTQRPAPAAPTLLPRQISASGYNSLVTCPYQYYARYMLRLAELDDVQEIADKRDYGILVHHVLTLFHSAYPRVSGVDAAVAQASLEKLSEEAFADVVARNYLAQAWLARWKALIPEYLDWQREREREGWWWHAGEVERSVEIATPAGARITLRGRLDRVDRGAAGAAVIDYKTRARKALQDSLELPGEDVQLPVYALLWGEPVAAALYLSIERDGVTEVELKDAGESAEAARERLARMHDALAAGAKLRAQGIEQACEYCDVRGLCRRNHWHE